MSKSVKNNPQKKKIENQMMLNAFREKNEIEKKKKTKINKMKKEMDKDISNIFHISVCRHVNKSSLILKV